jgi:DNA repair protein RecN (Recombination protein N)
MLKQLYIKNYTLISELNIPFNPGFSVITGETGAGKSIILGAIGLLLGNRADSKQVKAGKDKCTIEAHFDLSKYNMEDFFLENDIDYDANDTILRREISANGKSRAFINDTPMSLSTMRELGEQLVDIHSQHQNLLLQKEDFQLSVVDILAHDGAQLKDYQASYKDYHKALQELETLKEEIDKSRENEEFLNFQVNELEKANLQADEQEELEQSIETLSHAEEIKSSLFEADNHLGADDGAVQKIKAATARLHDIQHVYPDVMELANRLASSYIELKDISQEISSKLENIDFDPNELDTLNSRLDTIYSLEQKFHVSTEQELVEILAELKTQQQHLNHSDEQLQAKQQEVDELERTCRQQAEKLTALRKKAAVTLEKEMQQRLVPLGIPHVRFKVELGTKPLSDNGIDKVSFLFSANTSTAMQPVALVASGGEIARVMLSLKAMISGTVKLPTIIFDEIDTGVSGRVAEKMAQIMQEMGNHERQVISITHLPQIAALGSTHYKVSKAETQEGTVSRMTMLTPAERIDEIAQMLSGSDVTPAAIENAKELLKTK